jgi:hypothetical protein
MRRQPFLSTPAMIRDPSGHRCRGGAHSTETRMQGTQIIPCAAQIPHVLQYICYSMVYRHHAQIWGIVSSLVESNLVSDIARESDDNG